MKNIGILQTYWPNLRLMSIHANDFLAIAQPFLANYVRIQYVTSEDPLSQGAIVIDQLGHMMLLDRTYTLCATYFVNCLGMY